MTLGGRIPPERFSRLVYLRRRSRTKTCCAMTLLAVISSAVDSGRRHFRCLDLTAGVVDLDVLRLMDLADDLISLDTVGVDGVGTNLRGLRGGGLAESPPDRRGRDS